MTPPSAHLRVDQVSDLVEGLLDPDAVFRAEDHLAGCTQCAELLDDLAATRELLALEGTDPPPIPADVAARLDVALAGQRHRTWLPRVLVAAASVVVVGAAIGIGANQLADPGSGADALSAAGTQTDKESAGEARTPEPASGAEDGDARALAFQGLRTTTFGGQLTRRLAAGSVADQSSPPDRLDDATLSCLRSALGKSSLAGGSVYSGELDRQRVEIVLAPGKSRRAWAVDCTGVPRVVARTVLPAD